MIDRLPPHSIEAEQGTLGCVLQAPVECLDECAEKLHGGPAAFFDLRHRGIYQTLLEMRGQSVDLITLQQKLKERGQLEAVGGMAYLSTLPDATPSAANLGYYIEILNDQWLRRQEIQWGSQLVEAAFTSQASAQTIADQHEQTLMAARSDAQVAAAGVADSADCCRALTTHLEERFKLHQENRRSGLVTGFRQFDHMTDGLQPGEMTLIAARPSIGKTGIGLNIVDQICLRDKIPTLVVSCEMSRASLLRRMLSARASFPLQDLKSGAYSEESFQKFLPFLATVKASPLYIVEALGGITSERLGALLRRMWRRHGIRFLLLDYLQKIRPSQKYEKRTYEVAEASGVIKSTLQETNIAGLILAQLNRESEREKNRVPRMSDLADSGRIEQDADTIGLLHRDRAESPTEAKLILCKQRDGEVGRVELEFVPQFCRFQNPGMGPLPATDHQADR